MMPTKRQPNPGESDHCPSCRHQPPRHQLANLCHHPEDDIRNLRVDMSNGCPGYEYNPDWAGEAESGQRELFGGGE